MSEVDVNQLVIEVESDASVASENLDKLCASLNKFKDVINMGKPLNTFAKNMNMLGEACQKLSGFDTSKVAALGQLATSLGEISNVKLTSTLPKNFLALNEAINTASQADIQTTANLVDIIVGLGRLKGFTFPSSIANQLEKIAVLSKTIQGQDFGKLRELVSALLPLQQLANVDSKAMSGLATSMDHFTKATTRSATRGRRFNTVLANIRTRTLALVYSLDRVTNAMTSALGVYGDYVETLNLFEVSMESAGGAAYEFAEKCQNLLGVDLTQFMKAQGVFMTLGKGFGIATENAAVMSQQLTQLAYDISSFYNISVADAVQKVQSGFSGELEPVRRLGYDLSQAKLQAIAMSMGIDQSVTSMTQAEKAQLRYIALLTQVTDAQGDLARTLESPTNQLRIFQAQVQQLARSFGLLLLPVLNNVLPYLIAMVQVLKYIIDEIAAVLGYELPKISGEDVTSNMTSGVGDLDDALEDTIGTAEKLKNTLASFDEINLITSTSGGGGKGKSASDMASAWNFDIPTYDFLGDATGSRAKEIADAMKKDIQPALDKIIEAIKWIQDHTEVVKAILIAIGGAMVLGSLITKVSNLKKTFEGIEALTGSIKTALGIGFVIGGVTLSYYGGKAVGSGDVTKGIIEFVLGTGVAAIGGALLFGPAGAVISAGIALGFFVHGISVAEEEALTERVNEIFAAVNDGKITVDECKTSWEEFTKTLSMGEVDTTQVESAQREIELTCQSIQLLQADYAQGLISTEGFTTNMIALFGSLQTGVEKKLNELRGVINTALTGPLGTLMLMAGYTQEEIDRLMGITIEGVGQTFEEAKLQVENLNEALKNGTITYEGYQYGLGLVSDKLSKYGIDLTGASQAMDDFNKKWTDGIDINNFEEGIKLVEDISADYNKTMSDLTKDRDDLQNAFQTMLDSAKTEEERRAYETGLQMVNTLYDMNTKALNDSYVSFIDSVQDSTFKSWSEVLDTQGFDVAYKKLGDGFLELDKTIKDNLPEGLEITASAFSDTAFALKGYTEELDAANSTQNKLSYIFGGSAKAIKVDSEKWAKYVNNINKAFKNGKRYEQDFYDSTTKMFDEYMKNNKKSMDGNVSDVKEWCEQAKKTTGGGGKYIQGMLGKMPQELTQLLMQSTIAMMQQKGAFENTGIELMKHFSYAFNDDEHLVKRNLQNVITNAVNGVNTDTNKNRFSSAGFSLMSKFKQSFTDPDNGVKKTLQKTVDKVKELNSSEYSKKGKQLLDDLLAQLDGDNSAPANSIKQTIQNFKDAMEKNLKLGQTGTDEGEDFINKLEEAIKKGNNTIKEAASGVGKQMSDSMLVAANTSLLYIHQMMMKAVAEWNNFEITNGQAKYKGAQQPPEIVPVYAGGGFPSSGEFFFANEDGTAEYVGSLGGKTAVANNQQIIEGVSDGVYRALKSSGIIGDVKMIAKKSGKVVFAPSAEAGRVMQQSADLYNQGGGRY